MATSRSLPLIFSVGVIAAFAAPRTWASGGWYDEQPAVSTLAGDLDRLPAKTLGEILLETVEQGKFEIAEITDKDAVSDDDIRVVIEKIGKEKSEALAAEVDKLVMKARLTYVLRGGVLNVLYDIRDAITAPAPTDEQRRQYCEARLKDDGKAKDGIAPESYAVGDTMRPHLLYLQGAALFTDDKREDARPWLEEIAKKFPDHPRAETAAFLLARCDFTKARSFDDAAPEKEQEKKQLVDAAVKAFRGYMKKYPQGRYAADAHGWIGGLIWKDRPAEALEEYLAQLEDPVHPECRKSAAHMMERVLGKVMGHPDENAAVFKTVARHPRIAQAAVYLVLNAPEIDPYDGKYDEPADLKKWKLTVLPKLASAVSAETSLYKGDWSLRLRAMLAQAASSVGHQDEALKLTDASDEELKKSDDLLFARIVVLQRMKRPKDVAKLGKLFFENFEKSQLSMGVAVRLAQALIDDHRCGEAYVFLSKAAGANEARPNREDEEPYPTAETDLTIAQSGVYPDTDGGDAFTALKSTLLNFAPLKELEAVLDDKVWQEKADAFGSLQDALRIRKAAQEDYAGAAKMGGDDPFKQQMEDFQKLADKIKGANGKAKAQAMMELGDAYEEAANTAKPASDEGPGGAEDDLARRDDARALGIANPDDELESRNPMRHATKWWLRAARAAVGTDISAKARFKVLQGIEQTARDSDYDFTRAIEANMAQVSRDIYNILQKESPKSKESREAVYWNFEPCPKPKPKTGPDDYQPAWFVRGQEDPGREEDALSLLGGYHALHYNVFGEFPLASQHDDDNAVEQPTQPAEEPLPASAPAWEVYPLPKLQKQFEKARRSTSSAQGMASVNFLEDLLLLGKVSGLSHGARVEYIEFRMGIEANLQGQSWSNKPDDIPKLDDLLKKARGNVALKDVQDFVDYAEIYVKQAYRGTSYDDLHYPDYEDVEKACRAFLAKYPKSPRRQACSLVLIRSLFRQLPDRFGHEGPGDRHEHSESDARGVVELHEPFQPAVLEKAIAAYEKEFSKPRYAAEMRNYKGIIAWRRFDYGPALDLTIAQLEDEAHPDMRREGAVRLANIFADLQDPVHRETVLAALKSRPAAVEKLKQYLDVAPQNAGHPLRCMGKFLEDQLGFR